MSRIMLFFVRLLLLAMLLSTLPTHLAIAGSKQVLINANYIALPDSAVDLGYFVMGALDKDDDKPVAVDWKMLRAYWKYNEGRGAFCTSTVHHHQVKLPENIGATTDDEGSPLFVPKRMDEVYYQARESDLLSTLPIYKTDTCFSDLVGAERLEAGLLSLADLDRKTMNKAVTELQGILGFSTFVEFEEIPQWLVDGFLDDIDNKINLFMEHKFDSDSWLASLYVAPEDVAVIERFFESVSGAG